MGYLPFNAGAAIRDDPVVALTAPSASNCTSDYGGSRAEEDGLRAHIRTPALLSSSCDLRCSAVLKAHLSSR
jgi:hypothetical protein